MNRSKGVSARRAAFFKGATRLWAVGRRELRWWCGIEAQGPSRPDGGCLCASMGSGGVVGDRPRGVDRRSGESGKRAAPSGSRVARYEGRGSNGWVVVRLHRAFGRLVNGGEGVALRPPHVECGCCTFWCGFD